LHQETATTQTAAIAELHQETATTANYYQETAAVVEWYHSFDGHINKVISQAFTFTNLIHKNFVSEDVATLVHTFSTYVSVKTYWNTLLHQYGLLTLSPTSRN